MPDADSPSFDQKRFDATMKLVDFRLARIANRRQHEWKVTVGLWAILAAGIIQLRIGHAYLIGALLFALVLGYAIFWIRPHWVRSREDAQIAFDYQDYAAELLRPPLNEGHFPNRYEMPRWKRAFGFLAIGICWAQILTTGLLALGIVLTNLNPMPKLIPLS